MATFLTSLSDDNGMTNGERRFAKTLKRCLGDEYLVWHNVPIGSKYRSAPPLHPDFILLHPERGIIVIEVKDWHIDTIQSLDPHTATLLVDDEIKTSENPLSQSRGYSLRVKSLLEQDPTLIHQDGRYKGKLIIPCNYGVVFANIRRKVFEKNNLSSVIPSHSVICQDEMTNSIEPTDFERRLLGVCNFDFQSTLTNEQINCIRYQLFETIRIGSSSTEDTSKGSRVMDLKQERLARTLGDGHRIIQGVAGSGKTLILISHCINALDRIKRQCARILGVSGSWDGI